MITSIFSSLAGFGVLASGINLDPILNGWITPVLLIIVAVGVAPLMFKKEVRGMATFAFVVILGFGLALGAKQLFGSKDASVTRQVISQTEQLVNVVTPVQQNNIISIE